MSYYVRMMRSEDIRQVAEIDREAFPTMLPPPNFQRELQNRLAYYLLACDAERTVLETPARPNSGLLKVASRVMRFFNHERFLGEKSPSHAREYIIAFAGMWMLVDEVHITTIAVREAYKRRGIGEHLLISVIELAQQLKAKMLTLEVRVSNTIAQNLYSKYGFAKVGIRRSYYSDNYEDGLLMSTEGLTSPTFQERLQKLKEAHAQRWGITAYQICR